MLSGICSELQGFDLLNPYYFGYFSVPVTKYQQKYKEEIFYFRLHI